MEIKDWLVEYGGVENGYFKRNYYTDVASIDEVLDAYKKKLNYVDVYKTIYQYESDNVNDCLLVAPLVFDLDRDIENEGDFTQIVRDTILTIAYLEEDLGIKKEQMGIYFSGSKGFHIEIPYEVIGLEPSKQLAEQYKIIAEVVSRETIYKTIDMKIYEKRRLFRLPNTINAKTGLYKVQLPADMLYGLTLAEMREYASEIKEEIPIDKSFSDKANKAIKRLLLRNKLRIMKKKHPRTIMPGERKDLLPCVKKLLEEGVGKGGRNNTCIAIASSLAQSGIEEEEARDMVLSWNTLNDPPMPDREVIRTVQSGYQMAHEGRGYGCAFFKENDYCVGSECKLY